MNRFDEEIKRIIDTAARREELFVLIWGPGIPREDASSEAKEGYEKRCRIRKELRENFPQSEFEFSEDLHAPGVIGQYAQEETHAAAADLIIILAISPGALIELEHFSRLSWFRSKAWLFVPKQYLDEPGFVANMYNLIPRDQVRGYTPEEFKLCDVAKRMSVDIVTTAATVKRHGS